MTRRVCLAVLLIVSCACAREAGPRSGGQAEPAAEMRMAMAPPPAPSSGGEAPQTANPVAVPADRKIIRNGSLTLEVARLDEALGRIRSETEKAGGYITGESQDKDEFGARRASMTCRLPAGRLDAALTLFQQLGKAESVNVTADDITEQYFNLEIRLRNQQQLETRLLALLDKPGNKVSDLVEVEREVARVRGEIDELEGRKRFWDNRVAFSTLTVELHEPRPAITGSGGGVVDTLGDAILQAGQNLVSTVAWFIAALGVIVPAWLVLWVVWRLWKAIRTRRRSVGR